MSEIGKTVNVYVRKRPERWQIEYRRGTRVLWTSHELTARQAHDLKLGIDKGLELAAGVFGSGFGMT